MTAGDDKKTPSAAMSAARRELLERRLRGKLDGGQKPAEIPVLPPAAPRPASSSQARLYLLNELHPGNTAYHIHLALRLRGAIDRDALARAVEFVVNRHDSLRTRFEMSDKGLHQFIAATASLRLVEHPQPGASGVASETELHDAMVAAINRPFDLHAGPLLRADLFSAGTAAAVLLITVHHIVADEWSMGILGNELAAAYNAYASGAEFNIERLEIQYADFAAWQNTRVAERLGEQGKYWRRQLSGIADGVDLPYDRRRRSRPRFRGALRHHGLPPALADAVKSLARQHGATSFMVWLAAFQCLLYRSSGETDLCIGAPAANRPTPATEKLVGLFLNSLVLRVQIDGTSGFTALLGQVRQVAMDAYANQDYPFERLVADLRPERDLSHNPLFQTMFVMETDAGSAVFNDLDAERLELDTGFAKLDLTLFVRETAAGATLTAEYDRDLFDGATIDVLLQRFHALLDSLTAQPDVALDDLNLAVSGDDTMILHTPAGDADRQMSVLERFERQVAAHPEATAVVDADRRVSYRQLNELADRVATALRVHGAGSGNLVPIMIGRSTEQLAAMLGVMKSGAAYVPLDPDYPAVRHEQILLRLRENAEGPVLLLTAGTADARVAGLGCETVSVDTLKADVQPASSSPRKATPADLAYVIYTSGSSGVPKGVAVTHANLSASNAARLDYYRDLPERYLLVSSFAFDSSVAGIYWTLTTGGALVLAPQGRAQDPRVLAELIERESATHTLMLPNLYRLLLQCARKNALDSLQAVIVAGETCPASLISEHRHELAATRLYNEYGPTEATVWASVHECTGEEADVVPIGQPIPGASLVVVDGRGRPLPTGIGGELYIGGDGVARGYVDGSDRDATAFVENPVFGAGRYYRTGDRVRINRAGALEFLGRMDEQIKIRGFRVETGEIESVLRGEAGVADAAVIVERDDAGAVTGLVACICPGDAATASRLRELLSQRLPDYMLPRDVIAVPELPRMPNGKLDRRRLTIPAAPAQPKAPAGIAFFDETTAQVAAIWRRLLSIEEVAPGDDFFALGGHSLLGVSLMMEIERRFGVSLPLSTLFENPTLASLGDRIRGARDREQNGFVVAVRKGGGRLPLFCVHAGARLFADNLPDDQPVYLAYQRVGQLDPEVNSVEKMAQQYLAEVKQIQPRGPYALVGFSTGAQIAYDMARRLEADGETVATLVLGDPPTHTEGAYYKRRLAQKLGDIRAAESAAGRALSALRQAAGVAAARVNRMRLRLLSAYFERTRRSGPVLRRAGAVVCAVGVLLWIGGGFWMNAPQWRIAEISLQPETAAATNFTVPERGVYEVQIEMDVTEGKQALRQSVLALDSPSTIDLQWEISGPAGRIVGGDARDYLYLDRGPVTVFGKLRRVLLRVPFGLSDSYFRSFGILGHPAVARGLGKFDASEGDRLTLGVDAAALGLTAEGSPRLVTRLSRERFAGHYQRVAPWMYAGMVLTCIGILLLLIAFWRERQTVPEDLIRYAERSHLRRISDRYRYADYDGDVTLVFPAYYRGHLTSTLQFWERLVSGRLTTYFIEGVKAHIDLVREPGGAEVAQIVRRLLYRDDAPDTSDSKKEATS